MTTEAEPAQPAQQPAYNLHQLVLACVVVFAGGGGIGSAITSGDTTAAVRELRADITGRLDVLDQKLTGLNTGVVGVRQDVEAEARRREKVDADHEQRLRALEKRAGGLEANQGR